jgi:hypothetical protein
MFVENSMNANNDVMMRYRPTMMYLFQGGYSSPFKFVHVDRDMKAEGKVCVRMLVVTVEHLACSLSFAPSAKYEV